MHQTRFWLRSLCAAHRDLINRPKFRPAVPVFHSEMTQLFRTSPLDGTELNGNLQGFMNFTLGEVVQRLQNL